VRTPLPPVARITLAVFLTGGVATLGCTLLVDFNESLIPPVLPPEPDAGQTIDTSVDDALDDGDTDETDADDAEVKPDTKDTGSPTDTIGVDIPEVAEGSVDADDVSVDVPIDASIDTDDAD
jgi:hypothetical protein